jgi:hypothetical protein
MQGLGAMPDWAGLSGICSISVMPVTAGHLLGIIATVHLETITAFVPFLAAHTTQRPKNTLRKPVSKSTEFMAPPELQQRPQ